MLEGSWVMKIKNGKIHRSIYEKIKDYFGAIKCKKRNHRLMALARCTEIEGELVSSHPLMNCCVRYGCGYEEPINDNLLRGGSMIRKLSNVIVGCDENKLFSKNI